MKLNTIASSLVATLVLASSAAFAAPVTVPGGTVHFQGSLVNAACAVSIDSADQIVTPGEWTTGRFKAVGDTSGLEDFTIVLNDCDTTVSTTASVAFSGAAVAGNPDLLAVSSSTNTTTATGVGIEILDRTSTVLTPDGTDFSSAQTLIDGTNTLPFKARYKSIAAVTTAGQANADATFIMQYN